MNYFFKVIDLLRILIVTKQSFLSVFKKGFSIASSQILYNLYKINPNITTIIDVGANQGQFAIASTYFYKNAIIYSFEPVPNTFEILKNNTKLNPNIKTFRFALGSESGTINFYKNNYSHASSALPVSQLQLENYPETSQTEVIQVPIKCLDDLNIDTKGVVLLKLDVQGFEKEVVKGATKFLKKVDYVLFEASFVSMYDGEALFEEMHLFISSHGFEIVSPLASLQSNDLQIVQMDMLYRRKTI